MRHSRHLMFGALTLLLALAPWASAAGIAIEAEVNGKSGYVSGMGLLARPGEDVTIRLIVAARNAEAAIGQGGTSATGAITRRFAWAVDQGALRNVTGESVTYLCPGESGMATIRVQCVQDVTLQSQSGQEASASTEGEWLLRVYVQYPFDPTGAGALDGYPIGIYPDENSPAAPFVVRDNAEHYRPPRWFVAINREDRSVPISRHFTLGDFCSPYTDADRTFIALDERIVDRLEALVEALRSPAMPEPRIRILRGYISPNEATQLQRQGVDLSEFSRHKYGDGVALILDNSGDGKMDDINGDGRVDIADLDHLAQAVEKLERDTGLFGGLGICGGPTDPLMPDTPYISIDLRGARQRWRLAGMVR